MLNAKQMVKFNEFSILSSEHCIGHIGVYNDQVVYPSSPVVQKQNVSRPQQNADVGLANDIRIQEFAYNVVPFSPNNVTGPNKACYGHDAGFCQQANRDVVTPQAFGWNTLKFEMNRGHFNESSLHNAIKNSAKLPDLPPQVKTSLQQNLNYILADGGIEVSSANHKSALDRTNLHLRTPYDVTAPVDWCRWPVCGMYYQHALERRRLAQIMQTKHEHPDLVLHLQHQPAQQFITGRDSLASDKAAMPPVPCLLGEFDCPNAHAGPEFSEVISQPDNCVRVCYDSLGIAGRYCRRPPGNCRFFHPPEHIRAYLLQERFLHPKRLLSQDKSHVHESANVVNEGDWRKRVHNPLTGLAMSPSVCPTTENLGQESICRRAAKANRSRSVNLHEGDRAFQSGQLLSPEEFCWCCCFCDKLSAPMQPLVSYSQSNGGTYRQADQQHQSYHQRKSAYSSLNSPSIRPNNCQTALLVERFLEQLNGTNRSMHAACGNNV